MMIIFEANSDFKLLLIELYHF